MYLGICRSHSLVQRHLWLATRNNRFQQSLVTPPVRSLCRSAPTTRASSTQRIQAALTVPVSVCVSSDAILQCGREGVLMAALKRMTINSGDFSSFRDALVYAADDGNAPLSKTSHSCESSVVADGIPPSNENCGQRQKNSEQQESAEDEEVDAELLTMAEACHILDDSQNLDTGSSNSVSRSKTPDGSNAVEISDEVRPVSTADGDIVSEDAEPHECAHSEREIVISNNIQTSCSESQQSTITSGDPNFVDSEMKLDVTNDKVDGGKVSTEGHDIDLVIENAESSTDGRCEELVGEETLYDKFAQDGQMHSPFEYSISNNSREVNEGRLEVPSSSEAVLNEHLLGKFTVTDPSQNIASNSPRSAEALEKDREVCALTSTLLENFDPNLNGEVIDSFHGQKGSSLDVNEISVELCSGVSSINGGASDSARSSQIRPTVTTEQIKENSNTESSGGIIHDSSINEAKHLANTEYKADNINPNKVDSEVTIACFLGASNLSNCEVADNSQDNTREKDDSAVKFQQQQLTRAVTNTCKDDKSSSVSQVVNYFESSACLNEVVRRGFINCHQPAAEMFARKQFVSEDEEDGVEVMAGAISDQMHGMHQCFDELSRKHGGSGIMSDNYTKLVAVKQRNMSTAGNKQQAMVGEEVNDSVPSSASIVSGAGDCDAASKVSTNGSRPLKNMNGKKRIKRSTRIFSCCFGM